MKRYTRILAIVLVAAALLLAGCGESVGLPTGKKGNLFSQPVTAASLLETMIRQLWGQQSAEFTIQANFDGAVDSAGGDIKIDAKLEGEFLSTIRLHLNGSANMNMMGMDMELPLELYLIREGDQMLMCMGMMGQWTTQTIPMGSLDLDQALSSVPDFTVDEQTASVFALQDKTELIGERECYRLDLAVDPSVVGQMAGGVADVGDTSALDYSVSLFVDAETALPVRLSVGVNGPVTSEQFTLNAFALQLDFTSYNTVESIEIPAEVLANVQA